MDDALAILWWATLILGGSVVYITVRSGLMRLFVPQYCEIGKKYETLLADQRLRGEDREGVQFLIRHAFNGWLIWGLVLMLPVALVYSLFVEREDHLPVDLHRRISGLFSRVLLGLMAQNPIAGLLIAIEVFVLVAPFEAIRLGTTRRAIERGLAHAHAPRWAAAA